jgi:arsenate reductase
MVVMGRTKVLFVCTGNSGRSQIAEALLRQRHGDIYEVFSAGTRPGTLDPMVMGALSALGIDVSSARSKGLEEFLGLEFDIAVTLCDSARALCPAVPGARRTIHRAFPDPADFRGGREERLSAINRLIKEIGDWLEETFGAGPPRADDAPVKFF